MTSPHPTSPSGPIAGAGAGAGAGLADRLRRRLAERLAARGEDAGQAMIVVIFLILVLSTLAPVVAVQVDGEVPSLIRAANERAAVAALSAGVQFYRNHLDTDPNYATQTGCTAPGEGLGTCYTNPQTGDTSVTPTFCTGISPNNSDIPTTSDDGVIADNGSCDPALQFTNPPEAFVYTPNQSFLYNQSGGSAGQLLLTVYGRGGTPGNYQYATELVSFEEESIFSYAYVSVYEVLDPNSPQITDTDGPSLSNVGVEWSYADSSGNTVGPVQQTFGYTTPSSVFGGESAWQQLCQYKTWNTNTFIDANYRGANPSTDPLVYGSSIPDYYGPWYGSSTYNLGSTQFSFVVQLPQPVYPLGPTGPEATEQLVTVNPGAVSGSIGVPPCGLPYDFSSADNITGPVATGDQLRICGAPTFSGGSLGIPSVTSGAPANAYFLTQNGQPYHYPGSVLVVPAQPKQGIVGNETPNGPYPDSGSGQYAPTGFWYDEYTCNVPAPGGATGGNGYVGSPGSTGSVKAESVLYQPNAVHGVQLSAVITPPVPSQLLSYGTTQTSSDSYGCTFTGPTMIELFWNPGAENAATDRPGLEEMDVWSPLSGSDGPDANLPTGNPTLPQCSEPDGTNGSTDDFSLTNPLVTDIPVPTKQYVASNGETGDGVIYVRNPTNTTWSSDNCTNTGIPTCPYNYLSPPPYTSGSSTTYLPTPPASEPYDYFCPFEAQSFPGVSQQQCMQGDAYVEGELTGQLTIASDGNIILTRDTTDNCADENIYTPNSVDPSLIPACAIETYPDVLGLVANTDVDMSYDPAGAGFLAGSGSSAATAGVGLAGICPNESFNASDLTPDNGPDPFVPTDIWPACLVKNPIIDAAVVAANGSFGVQESSECPLITGNGSPLCDQTNGNALTLNGSDIGKYRGPFGLHSSTQAISGYNKVLSWDTRLQTAPPPEIVPQSSFSWVVAAVTGCGAINPAVDSSGICTPDNSPFGVTSSYGGTTVPTTMPPGTIIVATTTTSTTSTTSTTTTSSSTTTTKPPTTTSSSTTTTTRPTTTTTTTLAPTTSTSNSTTTTTQAVTTSTNNSTSTTLGGTTSSSSTTTSAPSTTVAAMTTFTTSSTLAPTTSTSNSTTTTTQAVTTTTVAPTSTTAAPTTTTTKPTTTTTTTLPVTTTTVKPTTTSTSTSTSSTTTTTSSTTTTTTEGIYGD